MKGIHPTSNLNSYVFKIMALIARFILYCFGQPTIVGILMIILPIFLWPLFIVILATPFAGCCVCLTGIVAKIFWEIIIRIYIFPYKVIYYFCKWIVAPVIEHIIAPIFKHVIVPLVKAFSSFLKDVVLPICEFLYSKLIIHLVNFLHAAANLLGAWVYRVYAYLDYLIGK